MNYPQVKIAKIAKVKGGKRLPKGEKLITKRTSHPYIRARDIRDGFIMFDDPVYITDEVFEKIKRYTVKTNDVCITIVGVNVGDVGLVPHFLNGANLTENAVKLTNLINDYDPIFLRYSLLSKNSQVQMKLFAAGAAQAKLGLYKVKEIEIPYPPLLTQRKIAGVLSAYDDLIENNTRRIAILEEMARLLYREWFVHFRFPGHEDVEMVDSELGPIPVGWVVKQLRHLGNIVLGKTPSKKVPEYYGDYMPFIKIPDMQNGIFCIQASEYLSQKGVESQSTKTVPAGSLCVSCIGTVGLVAIPNVPAQTNQQINTIIPNSSDEREFLYFALSDLKTKIENYGGGATLTYLSKSDFLKMKIVFPPKKRLLHFHKVTYPMFNIIRNLQIRNLTLRQTRDLLLPRLISGEVDVSELDIATGGDL